MDLFKLLLVGAGGFVGCVLRYLTVQTVDLKFNSLFPYGTLIVNIVGSLLLGIIYGWLSQKSDGSQNLKLLLATGFCGGFTTFSAFAFENFRLMEQKFVSVSLIYMMVSLILGVLAIAVGLWIARSLS
jgi:fluoride exporter